MTVDFLEEVKMLFVFGIYYDPPDKVLKHYLAVSNRAWMVLNEHHKRVGRDLHDRFRMSVLCSVQHRLGCNLIPVASFKFQFWVLHDLLLAPRNVLEKLPSNQIDLEK